MDHGSSAHDAYRRRKFMTDTRFLPHFLSPQHRHPANVPRHRHQRPLSSHRFEPTQQKLPEPHHGLDDAEHWFDRLFAQPLHRALGTGIQPMLHLRHRVAVRGRRRSSELFLSTCLERRDDLAFSGFRWLLEESRIGTTIADVPAACSSPPNSNDQHAAQV